MSNSCVGCKFLFGDGDGYSDYTWMDTNVTCALGNNPKLPQSEPFDWKQDSELDNWDATQDGRCGSFSPGPYITVSPDGEPDDRPVDAQQAIAILEARWLPEDTWKEFREGA